MSDEQNTVNEMAAYIPASERRAILTLARSLEQCGEKVRGVATAYRDEVIARSKRPAEFQGMAKALRDLVEEADDLDARAEARRAERVGAGE